MSDRGSWVTEYIYGDKTSAAVEPVLCVNDHDVQGYKVCDGIYGGFVKHIGPTLEWESLVDSLADKLLGVLPERLRIVVLSEVGNITEITFDPVKQTAEVVSDGEWMHTHNGKGQP